MIKNILTVIFSLIVLSGAFYINQYAGILQLILTLSIYGMLVFLIHYFWRSFRKKTIMAFPEFMRNFILSATLFIIVISAGLGYFGYYHNILHPKTLNQYTLSNGEKTLVFQEMIHIGSEKFYDSIAQEIKTYKQDGFVYYFEGVKAGTQENNDKFNQALGVEFDETLYQNMSKLYGLIPQDNQKFLGLINDQDFNVDTSIDEIIKEYEALKIEKNIEKTYDSPVDISSQTVQTLAELEGRELQVLVFINQALLGAMTKNEKIMTQIQNTFGNEELFQIILDKRNEIIAQKIIDSQHEKIFATYGALHFKGILEILQKNNPDWKIISKKEFIPFQ